MQSDADSDYLRFKEEFEKKEKEYRHKIHTLKKEVSSTKERINNTSYIKDNGNDSKMNI